MVAGLLKLHDNWQRYGYYRICTIRHVRIKIIHGNQNVFWVLTWVGRILVNIIPHFREIKFTNIMPTHVKTQNIVWLP